MKAITLLVLFAAVTASAQFTPYGIGLVQQPNDRAARYYLRATNMEPGTNIVFSAGSYPGSIKISTTPGGGGGTVTSFSAGNLSPLFTTAVATPNTTPVLSFAQISENQNLVYASPNGAPGNPSFRALVAGDIPALSYVTSVGLALPVSVFSISGSPVTGAGTLTGTFQNQNANTVFAGPASGVPATPAFRLLLPADIGVFTNHSDVVPTALVAGQVMIYDGAGHWTNGGVVASVTLPDPLTNHVYSSNLVGVVSNIVAGPFTNHDDVIPISLAPGDIFAWSGSAWTNGPPGTGGATMALTNAGDANGTLIYRSNAPTFELKSITAGAGIVITNQNTNLVIAATATGGGGGLAPGATTNFTVNWPDNSVYEFDEDFDSWRGTGSGLFTKNSGVAVTTVGGGGGIVNVASNVPPYYGMIAIQSSTTASNAVFVSQYSSTGVMPFQDLAHTTNWLFQAIFFFDTTNKGSVYRIGLADGIQATVGACMFPSNSLGVRFYQNLPDGNHFTFEARSNATSVSVQSSVVVAVDTPYKFKMWSTNTGIVWFSVNGEAAVNLTNSPIQSLGVCAYASTTNVGLPAQIMWLDRLSFRATDMQR